MHEEHYVFKTNNSFNKSIWRYMDFWKFLNLLEKSALYFSNSNSLGDNNEGRIPEFILKRMIRQDQEKRNTNNQNLNEYLEKNLRKTHLISSWSHANRESFAMWKMYAKNKTGIAIETDLYSLRESFKNTSRNIYIGEVNYINEDNYNFSTSNFFYPFITKLDFYEFENEIRCITILDDNEKVESKHIEVDLNVLIKKVHISPNSNVEFKRLIELLKKEYKLEFEIHYSKINDSWL